MNKIRVSKQKNKSGGQTIKMFKEEESTKALDVYRKWAHRENNYLVTYDVQENGQWKNRLQFKDNSSGRY